MPAGRLGVADDQIGGRIAADLCAWLGGVEHQGDRIEVKAQFRLGFEQEVVALDDGQFADRFAHQFAQFYRPGEPADDPWRECMKYRAPFRPEAAGRFGRGDRLARRREFGKPCREIDRFSEDVGAADDDRSEVKANPYCKPLLLRRVRELFEVLVNGECGVGGAVGIVEDCHEAVTGMFDDTAAFCFDDDAHRADAAIHQLECRGVAHALI